MGTVDRNTQAPVTLASLVTECKRTEYFALHLQDFLGRAVTLSPQFKALTLALRASVMLSIQVDRPTLSGTASVRALVKSLDTTLELIQNASQ